MVYPNALSEMPIMEYKLRTFTNHLTQDAAGKDDVFVHVNYRLKICIGL